LTSLICFRDQYRIETKPIAINSSSNGNNSNTKSPIRSPQQFGSSFEDVRINDIDQNYNSPPVRKEHSTKSKISNSHHNNKSYHLPKQHNLDQQMLLESMIDNLDEDQTDNNRTINKNHRLSHKSQSDTDSNGVFLLLDANEHLTVTQYFLSSFYLSILF